MPDRISISDVNALDCLKLFETMLMTHIVRPVFCASTCTARASIAGHR
jgi:hypothetical protein